MTFDSFRDLWKAAQTAPDADAFVAANPDAAPAIWDMAHNGFRAIRAYTGLSYAEFARATGISKGTAANWDQGIRTPPPYLLLLLAYAVLQK